AVGNDAQYQRFCECAGRPELASDPRFATNKLRVQNRATLVPLLEQLLRTRTTAAWEEALVKADVPHAPVWNYAELFSHPQADARGLRVTCVTRRAGRSILWARRSRSAAQRCRRQRCRPCSASTRRRCCAISWARVRSTSPSCGAMGSSN